MAAPSANRQSLPVFPKADAAVLSSKHPLPESRPDTIGPIYDLDNVDKPLEAWSLEAHDAHYPRKTIPYAPAPIPSPPQNASGRYLRAFLADNERLRLSMLWYYTRDVMNETEFLSGLQEKVHLAHEATGWDSAIIGMIDLNVYVRLATVGIDLGIVPRGETLCAHTITQPPGSAFLLPNMVEDWRFQGSPYVESGGLKGYAGVPLRLKTESGDTVSLGTLCVVSKNSHEPLTKSQQHTLAHLADWVVSDLVQCTRVRRQHERRRMDDLLSRAHVEMARAAPEDCIREILTSAYPDALVWLKSSKVTHIELEDQAPISLSDLELGVWENTDYLDEIIAKSNCHEPPRDKVVRAMAAKFECIWGPSILVVASKDCRLVFDDVDLWFVQSCASLLSQTWQKRLLDEAIAAKEKFLRGFSHQLRTPIHGILGSVELLAEELMLQRALVETTSSASDAGGHHIYIDTIKSSGRDLIATVNSMITLNRWADVAAKERSYSTHTIDQLEADLTNATRKAISGDSRYQAFIFFSHNLVSACDSFRADMDILRDSLFPLLMNAIQSTPNGIINVTVSLNAESRELIVDVEDTGHGMHHDDQKRIFEPYEKVAEHSTGAGLGLTLASKFATLLNGSIDLVSSAVGQGSHFRATFRDIDIVSSNTPSEPLAGKFKHLPSKFHHLAAAPDSTHLLDCLSKFLTTHHYAAADAGEESFAVIDYVPDSDQRRAHVAQIRPGQVAVCLVPSTDSDACSPCDNVVYVYGPFSKATLSLALAEADKLLPEIVSSQTDALDLVAPSLSQLKIEGPRSNVEARSPTSLPAKTNPTQPHVEDDAEHDLRTDPTPNGENAAVPAQDLSPAPAFQAVSSTPTALLVDDNVINLRIMQMYCSKRGLPYHAAKNGEEAVEMFSEHQQRAASGEGAAIQLVLMDLQMPVCDGLEATRQIRVLEKDKNWKTSTLFIVTGQDNPDDRASAIDAGAQEFFVKPLSLKELDRHMKQYFPAFAR
ncbi:hypothetical protein S7711_01802 [Stachybotrys chartarum IBT 7711]|uniref:histidine kinase n=1 Tax=Stachybotrys chartarum (strain CBS 109288 / IBT 7711) TaxID=1280523 RepID=A0A084AJ05_STACB|nr:hypothetical protein S7711_01802 [Stachybotrys chartarum IBT 7711]